MIALAEARDAGADEALLLNTAANLCEATTANVFLVHDGVAATPPLDSGMPGRDHARSTCWRWAPRSERCRSPTSQQAEEAFLTSSTREVQPLVARRRPAGRDRRARPGDRGGSPRAYLRSVPDALSG